MPVLRIFTSLAKDKIPERFANQLVPVLSKLVRKPEDKFFIVVSTDCIVSVGGQSNVPAAVATLESIGNLGLQENRVIIKEVSAYVQEQLGIAPINFLMSFYDIEAKNIGKNGTTSVP